MKKLLPLVLVAFLVAFTTPVFGQSSVIPGPGPGPDGAKCNVSQDVDLKKNVDICETVKTSDLYTTFMFKCFEPDSHAAARVFKCDENARNLYDPRLCPRGFDPTDSITGSFKSLTGIGMVNQSTGYMNNQGNAAAVAAVDKDQAYTQAEAAVKEINDCNTIYDPGFNCDKIDNSFNNLTGMVMVNQSTGSMNNQNNAAAIAVGKKGMVALADANLVQSNTGNQAYNAGLSGTFFNQNTICSSFNDGKGAIMVNQSAGSMNNQANVLAVSAVK